jgi:peptidoglycan-associated lipoprotein
MPQYKLLFIGLLAFLLAGCSGTQSIPDPNPSETTADVAGDMDDYDDGSMSGGEDVDYNPIDEGPALIVYFDFDSSELRADDSDTVARHAQQLGMSSGMSVRLEGHADERGSREYNIGLGERRAQTVRRLLLIQGASTSQVSTVSFGEERPAAEGSDENAYSQNRRVEITYTN